MLGRINADKSRPLLPARQVSETSMRVGNHCERTRSVCTHTDSIVHIKAPRHPITSAYHRPSAQAEWLGSPIIFPFERNKHDGDLEKRREERVLVLCVTPAPTCLCSPVLTPSICYCMAMSCGKDTQSTPLLHLAKLVVRKRNISKVLYKGFQTSIGSRT